MIREIGNCNMSVKEYWMSYNTLKCINNIDAAWEQVTSTCMNKVWRKLWPEYVHDFRRFEEVPEITNEVAAIAKGLRFDNDEPDDTTELLKSHSQPPTNEELDDMVAQLKSSSSKKNPFYDLQKPKTYKKFWLGLICTCRR
jgi:hypothetical protein